MINIQTQELNNLIDRVIKDKIEVHIEVTPENTTIDIQPWKPIEMRCPYGRAGESEC